MLAWSLYVGNAREHRETVKRMQRQSLKELNQERQGPWMLKVALSSTVSFLTQDVLIYFISGKYAKNMS